MNQLRWRVWSALLAAAALVAATTPPVVDPECPQHASAVAGREHDGHPATHGATPDEQPNPTECCCDECDPCCGTLGSCVLDAPSGRGRVATHERPRGVESADRLPVARIRYFLPFAHAPPRQS